ncbi:TRNA/rRNA methyltransferase [Mesomycoplasma dispar]|uniref:Putative tRNA (cytidine(34)-2'-O)-methyltransferase n=1 Tax=Mesomycoplasma dispar TaxID=86660 RepID=A0AAJ5NL53_9BACT|nr:tRNA (cytidine(34)-2'-O)-methyltransferase [Mesomycoplasma dispar]AJR12602.1 RNA methyltransferase [Mesomycoplasma dispar]ATP60045.1 tRNA (cytidine(34)-2'-O)-methyltransferase [Mesomycoplasma dispar]VEU61395.1 TRNA/rRNA methyltransferase [Mesomycoplasma dispar]
MINIVLFQPEIGPNTGNIIRSCFVLNMKLHIIKPIAFDLDPKHLKRPAAGILLSDIEHEIYENWQDFIIKYGKENLYFITRYGKKIYTDVNYNEEINEKSNIFLVFGRESTGIPVEILKKNKEKCLRIPMVAKARSLNLANTVVIVAYEVYRQLDFQDLSRFEVQKGKNYLDKN